MRLIFEQLKALAARVSHLERREAARTAIGCKVRRSTGQTIPSGVITPVSWDQEDYDSSAFHSTSVNTSRITIPAGLAGYYLVSAYGRLPASGAVIGIAVNGVEQAWDDTSYRAGLSLPFNLVVGDYVEMWVYQASGGSASLETQSRLAVTFLGV